MKNIFDIALNIIKICKIVNVKPLF